MLSITDLIKNSSLLILLGFATSTSLLSKPILLSELEIYYREGFSEISTKQVWSKSDSLPIFFEGKDTISLPFSNELPIYSLFQKETVSKEFSIQIRIPSSEMRNLQNPGLKIYQIGENWEIFLNGTRINDQFKDGRFKSKPLLVPLPIYLQSHSQNGNFETVTLRIKGISLSPNFGIILHKEDQIENYSKLQFDNIEIFPFFSSGIFLILGIYLVYLYTRVRRSREVLYFGIFQLLYSFYTITLSNYANLWLNNLKLLQIMETNILFLAFIFIVCFHDRFLLNKIQPFSKFVISFSLFILLLNTGMHDYFPNLVSILTVIETPQLFFYLFFMSKILRKDFAKNKRSTTPIPAWSVFIQNRAGVLILVIFFVASAIYFETFLEWTFKIKTPIVIIASISYSIFLAFFVIRKIEDGLVQKTKLQLNLLHEKKQFEFEKQLAIQNERKSTFSDIHDETSADLTFVKLRIEKLLSEASISKKNGEEILNLIQRISFGIRQKLISYDDERNISESFAEGVKLLLLRKYESVGKKVFIDTVNIEEQAFSFPYKTIDSLCKILREIANNDIKYGKNDSVWKFNADQQSLLISFRSESIFNELHTTRGLGHKNIKILAKDIGFQISEFFESSYYHLQLVIGGNHSKT